MARLLLLLTVTALVLAPHAGPAAADEGMWMPNEIGKLPLDRLKKRGMEITPQGIWNDAGPSLKDAILQVGGEGRGGMGGPFSGFGSAAFVSGAGLILTNHHVAYDALTALATPEDDVVENGFIAEEIADERPCEGLAVRLTTAIVDVTDEVMGDVKDGMTPADRQTAIRKAIERVLDDAREKGNKEVAVEEMFQGNRFFLYTFDTIRDVRMVYAPPRAIGEYGGDIDNWMWPRHTGDFTYLRAYVGPNGERRTHADDNVPYEPKSFLKLSAAGYQPGDFCFIMGYPGRTFRHRSSYSVDFWEKVNYPDQIKLVEQRLAQVEEMASRSAEQRIKLSSMIKQLQNALKNFRGMVDGMKALNVVERRREQEQLFLDWVEADEGRKKKYGEIFSKIDSLYQRLAKGRDAAFLEEFQSTIPLLRRQLFQGRAEQQGSAMYADANSTVRLTYGSIGGYSPKDAVMYRYYTSMEGVAAKDTGKAPFDMPAKQKELIARRDWGRWADPNLGTVPVCFLSDTDITGGNSGSAIMNGRGEMIGIAFDGNYEAMTSDFLFENDITRTINVDIRYVLWCTDKMANLGRLLEEMEIVGGAAK